jgi:hypothetical protein
VERIDLDDGKGDSHIIWGELSCVQMSAYPECYVVKIGFSTKDDIYSKIEIRLPKEHMESRKCADAIYQALENYRLSK